MDSSWRSLEDHHHHHHQEEEEWSHDHKVTNHDIVSNDSPECHILMSVQSCALCIMTDILKYLMTTGMPMQHAGLASQDPAVQKHMQQAGKGNHMHFAI